MTSDSYELPVGRGAQKNSREQAKRFLVITNGVRTESDYFYWLNNYAYDIIEVSTDSGLSLDDILDRAERAKDAEEKYDGIAIVLDIDDQLNDKRSKKNLKQFLSRAKDLDALVCLSNESFEVWLLAHKTTVPKKAGERKVAQELAIQLKILDSKNKKSILDEALQPEDVSRALKEAIRLRKAYSKNILKRKPGTDADLFVGKIRLIN